MSITSLNHIYTNNIIFQFCFRLSELNEMNVPNDEKIKAAAAEADEERKEKKS